MSDAEARWNIDPDPELDLLLDATSIKVMAHPVRIRILGELRKRGPLTATGLGELLGLNSGATSYHLRQLALYRMVVEDEERGNARERWWRAAHRSTRYAPDATDIDGEDRAAVARALALVFVEYIQRAIDELPQLPAEWMTATTLRDYVFRLTPAEAESLIEDLVVVFSRYRADHGPGTAAPADAKPFHVQLQSFLRPGL